MKKWFWILLCTSGMVSAQEVEQLTLEQAQQWAAEHYPLLKKKSLSRASLLAANDNLGKNFLPQINVNAQASWQSDVTQVPTRIPIPGLEFETVSKDQYRAVADVSQLLYDGGSTRVQKDLNELKALLSEEEVNVGLQMLKEKMNGLYLNALLLGEQRKLNALVVADLDAGLKKVEAQVQNGTAFRSNLALLQSEKLKILQRDMELQEEITGLMETMALLTGKEINPEAELLMPASGTPITGINEIIRPELALYKLQDSLYQQQDKAIDSRLRPKISLFANGGYGKPGLNMMKNEFAPFVTTGLRVNWNIGGLYTQKKDRELNTIYRQEVQVQQENFLLNTQAQLIQQQSVIRKLQRTMQTDLQIIELKKQVKESAKAQLDNGVITASDYLREVHAEDQARQNLTLHQVQLLNATIQYQTIAGK
jgi:outer membrane protein TolC